MVTKATKFWQWVAKSHVFCFEKLSIQLLNCTSIMEINEDYSNISSHVMEERLKRKYPHISNIFKRHYGIKTILSSFELKFTVFKIKISIFVLHARGARPYLQFLNVVEEFHLAWTCNKIRVFCNLYSSQNLWSRCLWPKLHWSPENVKLKNLLRIVTKWKMLFPPGGNSCTIRYM